MNCSGYRRVGHYLCSAYLHNSMAFLDPFNALGSNCFGCCGAHRKHRTFLQYSYQIREFFFCNWIQCIFVLLGEAAGKISQRSKCCTIITLVGACVNLATVNGPSFNRISFGVLFVTNAFQ